MQNEFLSFLDALKEEANKTFTENGAVTYRSSGSENVDIFASIGALRSTDDQEIVRRFIKAWAEDRDLAMKILFYARDIRGGLGERRVFRVILEALSLGIYFAERNTGLFRNHFITFSKNPQLVEIKGNDLTDRVRYCSSFDEVSNTNIQKAFELILKTAVTHRIPQSEMPETLYIISDMEFDSCTADAGMTNFEYAKELYKLNSYQLPKVVFWNVQSRNRQVPVKTNEQGVALVSGFSDRIFSMVIQNKMDPFMFMMSVIGSERYSPIKA